MSSVLIILFLKSLLFAVLFGLTYLVWKTYQKQKWNQILKEKQVKSGKIELLGVRYRTSYVLISVFFFVFFVTLNSPLSVANVLDTVTSAETYMMSDSLSGADLIYRSVDPDTSDIYIVEMNTQLEEYEFNLFGSSNNDDLADYYEYKVNVLEEVYATTSTMFTEESSKVILSETTSITYQSMPTSSFFMDSVVGYESAANIQYGEVYLIVGGYVTSSEVDSDDIIDSRLSNDNYIYTYHAILLEGYDTSKSLLEQSEEIRRIVEEFTKDLP